MSNSVAQDVKVVGAVKAGDKLRTNGHEFTVVQVFQDKEGCQQWTLAAVNSDCLRRFDEQIEGQRGAVRDHSV